MSRAIGWLLVIALLLCLAVPGFIAFRVWHVARVDDRTPADAIVVLGAAQYDGVPTPVFQSRLDHAATLYEEGVAPQIITVGGNQPGDRF
ncbi:MAG: YdcF family protein, partial [Dietzia cercidiphylli]